MGYMQRSCIGIPLHLATCLLSSTEHNQVIYTLDTTTP